MRNWPTGSRQVACIFAGIIIELLYENYRTYVQPKKEITMARFIIAALMVISSTCFAGTAFLLKIGLPAPYFTLKETTGKSLTLSSFRGKTVLLNFWSTTCPPCIAELDSLEALHRETATGGLVVIGIALERDAGPVQEVISRKKLTFAVLLDPDKEVYFDSYGLFGLPFTLIINKDGIVVQKVIGEADWNSPAMKEKIRTIR